MHEISIPINGNVVRENTEEIIRSNICTLRKVCSLETLREFDSASITLVWFRELANESDVNSSSVNALHHGSPSEMW